MSEDDTAKVEPPKIEPAKPIDSPSAQAAPQPETRKVG
jgi:hypothetical protein